MAGREVIAEGEVRVGVDTRMAEEGLKTLYASFDRSMKSMDRRRAEATVSAKTTEFDKSIAEVKTRLVEIDEEKADPEIRVDTKSAKAEIKALRLELKRLQADKATIQVDSKQLKDANKQLDLNAQKQEKASKAADSINAAEARLTKTRERALSSERTAVQMRDRAHTQMLQEAVDLDRLRKQYTELSKSKSRLEKEGSFTFGGFPGRTKEEARELEKVGHELDLVGHKITSLGGDLDGLDRNDKFGAKLLNWAGRMRAMRISIGPLSGKLGTFAAALSTLGPLILSLTGGLGALIGVLGAGLVGAASVGGAALAGFALTAGGVVAVSKNMVSHLKEQVKAASDYRDALLKYGAGSTQAETKHEQLQNITAGISKSARQTVLGLSQVSKEWDKLTQPSHSQFFNIVGQGLKSVKSLMPEFAHETNATFKVLAHGLDPLLRAARSSKSKGIISDVMGNFRDSLPELLKGLGNIATFIGNVVDEASKFDTNVTGGFQRFTKTLADDSGTKKFRTGLDTMIHQAGDLLHLFKVAGEAILLFFGDGAEAGDEMTNSLSHTIERWNEWMRSAEGKNSLHDFFHQSAEDTSNFFGALLPLIATFVKLTYALQPVTSGVLKFANALGLVVTWISKFAPIRPMLVALGATLGAIFIVNKVKGYADALNGVVGWLEKLVGMNATTIADNEAKAASYDTVAASAQAAATAEGEAGAAGAAGGAGVVAGGGAASGGILARLGTSVPEVVVVAAGALGAAKLGETAHEHHGSSNSIFPQLGGLTGPIGDSPIGKPVVAGAHALGIGDKNVKIGHLMFNAVDEGKKATDRAMAAITNSILFGLGKIKSTTATALHDVTNEFKKNSPEWRKATVQAMADSVLAIERGMAAGTVPVKKGKAEITKLLEQIHLTSGSDPLGLAKGFAKSFTAAGHVTAAGVHSFTEKLAQMPAGAREKTEEATMQMLRKWADGRPKIEAQIDLLNKHMEHKFGATNAQVTAKMKTFASGLGGIFGSLGETVAGALEGIGTATQRILEALGLPVGRFASTVAGNLLQGVKEHGGNIPGINGEGKKGRKGQQTGGFTVPGRGDGDSFPFEAEHEGFVLNREASRAVGFQSGGVPVELEPGERYFTRNEAKAMGHANLEALNNAIPRFQGGGEPRLSGPGTTLVKMGQAAIHKGWSAAQKYVNARRPQPGGGGTYSGPTPAGVGSFQGFPVDKWIIPELLYAVKHGWTGHITSGWRTEAQSAELGYPHDEHTLTHYPGGAVDFGGMEDPAGAANRAAFIRATKGYKGPHLLLPQGFRDDGHMSGDGHQRGGTLRRRMASGGSVAKSMAQVLINHGLSKTAAAGIMGNAWQESSWNPAAQESETAGGLWGFTASPNSLNDLKAAASKQGVPWTNAAFQTQFMLAHVPSSLIASMNKMNTVQETTEAFMGGWEHPAEATENLGRRLEGAAMALKTLGGIESGKGAGKKTLTPGQKEKHAIAKYEKNHPSGSTSAGGGTYGPGATKKEIKDTKLSPLHKSPLPSWAKGLPLHQREELEGRGETTEGRRTTLSFAEEISGRKVTKAEGALSRMRAKAEAAHEFRSVGVEAARKRVKAAKAGQKAAYSAAYGFEKGIIKKATKKIKEANKKLGTRLTEGERKKWLMIKAKWEGIRATARGEKINDKEIIESDELYGEEEAAEIAEETEASAAYMHELLQGAEEGIAESIQNKNTAYSEDISSLNTARWALLKGNASNILNLGAGGSLTPGHTAANVGNIGMKLTGFGGSFGGGGTGNEAMGGTTVHQYLTINTPEVDPHAVAADLAWRAKVS